MRSLVKFVSDGWVVTCASMLAAETTYAGSYDKPSSLRWISMTNEMNLHDHRLKRGVNLSRWHYGRNGTYTPRSYYTKSLAYIHISLYTLQKEVHQIITTDRLNKFDLSLQFHSIGASSHIKTVVTHMSTHVERLKKQGSWK